MRDKIKSERYELRTPHERDGQVLERICAGCCIEHDTGPLDRLFDVDGTAKVSASR